MDMASSVLSPKKRLTFSQICHSIRQFEDGICTQDKEISMRIPVDQIRMLSYRALANNGLSVDEARTVTDVLVEAELRGRKTHGLIRISGVIQRRASKDTMPIQILRENVCYALLDGGDNLGYLVAHRCVEIAIAKAKQTGVAIVGANNLGHTGMMGYYVSMMAERQLIGLGVCDCMPRIVPWGGIDAIFGTNPIAIGIPAPDKYPIVIDLSTAALTMGDIALVEKRGERIPAGRALDRAGHFTDDPAEARKGSVLPFGEHKGYALALAVQIFSSVLVGADVMPKPGKNYGVCFIAFDPTAFVAMEDFQRDASELIQAIKASRKMKGVEEILIPGERAYREREQRLEEGVELDDTLYKELSALQ